MSTDLDLREIHRAAAKEYLATLSRGWRAHVRAQMYHYVDAYFEADRVACASSSRPLTALRQLGGLRLDDWFYAHGILMSSEVHNPPEEFLSTAPESAMEYTI